jgi:hypothetical protein
MLHEAAPLVHVVHFAGARELSKEARLPEPRGPREREQLGGFLHLCALVTPSLALLSKRLGKCVLSPPMGVSALLATAKSQFKTFWSK